MALADLIHFPDGCRESADIEKGHDLFLNRGDGCSGSVV
jgi:hypothetical protein